MTLPICNLITMICFLILTVSSATCNVLIVIALMKKINKTCGKTEDSATECYGPETQMIGEQKQNGGDKTPMPVLMKETGKIGF